MASCSAWLAARDNGEESRKTGDALVAVIEDYVAHQDQMGTPFEEQWLANGKKCLCPACTAAGAGAAAPGSGDAVGFRF